MSILDPLSIFEGGPLHSADIAIAEALGGRPGKTITWHASRPLVAAGLAYRTAAALLHWGLIGVAAYGLYRTVTAASDRAAAGRRTRRTRYSR